MGTEQSTNTHYRDYFLHPTTYILKDLEFKGGILSNNAKSTFEGATLPLNTFVWVSK